MFYTNYNLFMNLKILLKCSWINLRNIIKLLHKIKCRKRECIEIISSLKKIYVYIRGTVKLISLIIVGLVIIVAAIVLIYKPIYKVTVNGKNIGYCEDKEALQNKIDDYMENGEEGQKNVAFVQIDDMPEYQMCLQKKGITTNDDEIFNKIKETGITYYRYYAIADDNKEKIYLATFDEAESAIKELKKKESQNSSDLTIVEKYETNLPTISTKSEAISKLYEEKVVVATKTYPNTSSSGFSTSRSTTTVKKLGISCVRPVSGVLTSRFGSRWGSTHTGIDIGAPSGTGIKAAAGGTVIFSGWKGTLGKLVVISHGNGIQTYYGHCSSLLVSTGQKISAGQIIAKVGSTGRSTGSHLHFEIRVNGSAINPQSYIGY